MKIKAIVIGTTVIAITGAAGMMAANGADRELYINGTQITENQLIESEHNVMLPLRTLCEKLGMKVLWDGENNLININDEKLDITCSPYSDGYLVKNLEAVARSVDETKYLGQSPMLINDGTTYVPTAFAGDILGLSVSITDDKVEINEKTEAEETPVVKAVITEVADGSVTIYDIVRGEIVINLSEETELVDAEGNAVETETLSKGDGVEAVLGEAMTMSIPPQTNASKITITAKEAYEVVSGTVVEASAEAITIGDATDPTTQTVFNMGDQTKDIVDINGEAIEADDIAVGDEITVIASTAATKSIPPQKSAYGIKVMREAAAETEAPSAFAVITEVSEEGVTVYDTLRGEMIVTVGEETVMKDEAGESIALSDLAVGDGIEVVLGETMTMSLPPITDGVQIIRTAKEAYEVVSGKVCAVASEEGALSVTIGDEANPMTQTVLNVDAEETEIIGLDGNVITIAEINKDDEITVIASAATTRSIPPQKLAQSIRVMQSNIVE